MPLFNFSWYKELGETDEVLFPGAIYGISELLRESVNQGNVREIRLEKGLLLVNRSPKYNVACVLVVTKITEDLRRMLDVFSEKFYTQFSEFFEIIENIDHFKPAQKLVDECFPYIPNFAADQVLGVYIPRF